MEFESLNESNMTDWTALISRIPGMRSPRSNIQNETTKSPACSSIMKSYSTCIRRLSKITTLNIILDLPETMLPVCGLYLP